MARAWANGAAYPLDFCHLCEGPVNRVPPRAVATYVCPVFGFTYRACAGCYPALVGGLLKAKHARPSANAFHRPWRRRGAQRRILAAGNHADGAGESALTPPGGEAPRHGAGAP